MEFKEVRYVRRINLGAYEFEELELSASVGEDEDVIKAGAVLKSTVHQILKLKGTVKFEDIDSVEEGGEIKMKDGTVNKAEDVQVVHEEKPKTKLRKKAAVKKKATAKKEEPKKEEVKEVGPVPTVIYARENADHRESLAKLLHSEFPGWDKNPELKVKAKDASVKIEGKEYIFDERGNLLKSFKEKVISLMS